MIIRLLMLLCGLLVCVDPGSAQILFQDITSSAGLTHTVSGRGACIVDINNDGLEDIYLTNRSGPDRLYRNLGDMHFEEIAATVGLTDTVASQVIIAADYNRDQRIDLFVGAYNEPCRLYRQASDGTFSDVTTSAGIDMIGDVRGGSWLDYDRDGQLDLYVTALSDSNKLYRNNGDGTFSDVTSATNTAGPTNDLVQGMGVVDFDWDGDDDIWLTQDGFLGNVLLEQTEDHVFVNIADAAGINLETQGMGATFGDYNRDGRIDAHVTNLAENHLFSNQGDGTFFEVGSFAGVGDGSASMAWGTFLWDVDNDGWLDIYNNNGTGFADVPNSLFHNRQDLTFENISVAAGVDSWNDGYGCAYGDLDNDGDLDMVLTGVGDTPIQLFENITNYNFNWIQFTLASVSGHRQAIGSRVELHAPGMTQIAYLGAGNGFCSQNTLRIHFGLEGRTTVDSVFVYWPSGERELFIPNGINTHYVLIEHAGVTDVENEEIESMTQPQLFQNYPNPFAVQTTIPFQLDRPADVALKIYNPAGQLVQSLPARSYGPGTHVMTWDATTGAGQPLSYGMYFYAVEIDGARLSPAKRMSYVR